MENINIRRHILDFVADHDARLNFQPTRSELRKMLGGLSESVDLHLEQLEREGFLDLGEGESGIVTLPRLQPQIKRIGVRGGSASPRLSHDVPRSPSAIALDLSGVGITLDGDLAAYVVSDNSMTDAGIKSGDVAILKTAPPERGEIVAVEISGLLVLRRYVIICGIPHFLAENPVRPDLVAAFDHSIHGVLACLICADPSRRGHFLPPINKVNYESGRGLATESVFVQMLKTELEKSGRTKPEQVVRASVPGTGRRQGKKVEPRKPKKRGATAWPEAPSGIALNDTQAADFGLDPHRFVCDEQPTRPFGDDFVTALARVSEESDHRIVEIVSPSRPHTAKDNPKLQNTHSVQSADDGPTRKGKHQNAVDPSAETASREKPNRQGRSFLRV